jgi:membrane-bound lytic murein transglycosylase A
MSRRAIQTGNWLPPTTMNDILSPVKFAYLDGWREQDHRLALEAFKRSAVEILETGSGFKRNAAFGGAREDWLEAASAASAASDARVFFETYFQPYSVTDATRPQGLFTGYYEPLLQGAWQKSDRYPVPVYNKPQDLAAFTAEETARTGLSYGRHADGVATAYNTRQDIEQGALEGKAQVICWLSDWVDAFFMHVQGQGRVEFEDGSQIRLSYSGKTGHPYSGIGHILVERGVAPKEKMSMQVLRDWLAKNQDEARSLMWHNKSYIFFRRAEVTDSALGGIGAAKVNLTPLHSLAVDRAHWMFGTPLWINTSLPPETKGGPTPIQRLMIAQDTGSAIKGIIRGDFFWGWGEQASDIAGYMKSEGTMTALLPRSLARRWGHLS